MEPKFSDLATKQDLLHLQQTILEAFASIRGTDKLSGGPRFLNTKQACQRLGCSASSLANYRKRGLIQCSEQLGKNYYSVYDLDRLMEGKA